MTDVFAIEGPALISFSGGRTSAYMLWRILQAHGGALPDDVNVCFANTGKEMPQTLDFVRDCGENWGVDIVWLEWRNADPKWTRVDHATASRNGEPFMALIRKKQYLPNPVTRFCTAELKIRVMRDFAKSLGWKNWTNVIGLRADEPYRVAKAKVNSDPWDNNMPLARAGITKTDVMVFWQRQNFDLRLPNIGGKTPLGNCDLCFLKASATRAGIMRDHPELARWWLEAEAEAEVLSSKPSGARFRKDGPSYASLFAASQNQGNLPLDAPDELQDCMCHE